jgi:hypothetical protein
VNCAGTLEGTRLAAQFLKAQSWGHARTALSEGWVDQATVDGMMAEVDAWAERPDAFYATTWFSAVGWVD